jgi:hypothetical protein
MITWTFGKSKPTPCDRLSFATRILPASSHSGHGSQTQRSKKGLLAYRASVTAHTAGDSHLRSQSSSIAVCNALLILLPCGCQSLIARDRRMILSTYEPKEAEALNVRCPQPKLHSSLFPSPTKVRASWPCTAAACSSNS